MATPLRSAYEQVLADLQRQLEQAKEEFARAGRRLNSLQAAVQQAGDRLESLTKARLPINAPASADAAPYASLSIVEAAQRFLDSHHRFADCNVIADGIVRGGFQTKSPKFVRNVLAMLYRDWKRNPQTAFTRDRKKRWGLKVWKHKDESVASQHATLITPMS